MTVTINGEKLRGIRMRRYLSQRELSKMSQISHETINRIENGHRIEVRPRTVRFLAQGLNIHPDEIVIEGEANNGTTR